VDAIWRRLLERCGPGAAPTTTDDPDLHLLVEGRRIDSHRRLDGRYAFLLPENAAEVRIVSRAVVPAALGLARDSRRLGVAVSRISLWRGPRLRLIEASDPALEAGFHLFEPESGLRWTDGDALVPTSLFEGLSGPCQLELHVACTTLYPVFGEEWVSAAA
jgi:hypothetical protein